MAPGIVLIIVNVYEAEIASPHLCGITVVFPNVTLNIADALSSWVGYASNFSKCFPIVPQCVPALMLIAGCFYILLSPRWLTSKDRNVEEQAILQRLHDDHEDPVFWGKEYLRIAAQLAAEQQERVQSSLDHTSTSAKGLQRGVTAVAPITSVQRNVFYAGLGFSAPETVMMAGVFGICNTAGGTTNLLLFDRLWRPWGKAGIAFIILYIYSFGATFAASPYAYAAEALPNKVRALGMALALLVAKLLH
ncbi:uncharacterized protein A1O5_11580 [Cladophialophora psammophila CBS 110553]|uniref:Major facilitator superfamily (MFS) profile domain-containing protein n=1 Tax=Cladophialophora psammophila CBS 110553 TaxID=1182543 RepID=W9WYD0_9EURO|nr:uncharacterized protein A1O5_11580 [Cladophialophora psammophila CBS 110553]EXJ63259.1 hypothetical protein A1O5_11580 [Cladophialophora psammophila CBS 110553]